MHAHMQLWAITSIHLEIDTDNDTAQDEIKHYMHIYTQHSTAYGYNSNNYSNINRTALLSVTQK